MLQIKTLSGRLPDIFIGKWTAAGKEGLLALVALPVLPTVNKCKPAAMQFLVICRPGAYPTLWNLVIGSLLTHKMKAATRRWPRSTCLRSKLEARYEETPAPAPG